MRKKAGSDTSSEKPTSARLLPNRPLDAETINQLEKNPVEVDPEHPVAQAFAEAAAEVGPEHVEEPKQTELLAMLEQAKVPIAVQNGRIFATYVGLGLERDKDGEKLVHLDFSFPLEDAHNGFIPKKAKDAWDFLKESDNKLIQIKGIPPVTLDVYTTSTEKRPELHLVGAAFSKAVISLIEEVGKGKAKMVTRFAFRLCVERSADVIEFAAWRDGEEFFITMPATQKALK